MPEQGAVAQQGQPVMGVDPLNNNASYFWSGHYPSPNGRRIGSSTTLDSLFSDDFGGAAINAASPNWDVIQGGLGAVTSGQPVTSITALPGSPQTAGNPVPIFSQGAIGSGLYANMSYSVSASALTVNMGTSNGDELWFLSRQVFAGKEDILVILSKSQALAANSLFIGLVEVDPVTFVPLLNPNIAADGNGSSEFTNRGGCEFAPSATTTAYQAEAIGDSSPSKATGVVGTAVAWSTTQECLIEIDSRDITVSTAAIDAVSAKLATASRLSSQCPNDKKLYKLCMRFRNPSAPGSSTAIVIQRILVIDNYEQRVQIGTGEGDLIPSKGVPVTWAGQSPSSGVSVSQSSITGTTPTRHKLFSAATTNATSVKTTTGKIVGGCLANMVASIRYFKFYNKASAPTVGTDTPVYTIPLQPNTTYPLADLVALLGDQFATGIAYAITGGLADSDTTAIGANDVAVNIAYY